jgi:hypothetical protein
MPIPEDFEASKATMHARGRLAQGLLATTAALDVIVFGCLAQQTAMISRVRNGIPISMEEATASDGRLNTLAILGMVLLVPTAVLFLRWFHRAVLTARKLNPELDRTPSDAVAAFFIPLANIVAPYSIARDVAKAIDPDDLPPIHVAEPMAGAAYRGSGLSPSTTRIPGTYVGLWWATYIVGGVISSAAMMAAASHDVDSLLVGSMGSMLGPALHIVSAVLAIVLVRRIGARLDERARRQAAVDAVAAPSVAAAGS